MDPIQQTRVHECGNEYTLTHLPGYRWKYNCGQCGLPIEQKQLQELENAY